MKYSLPAGSPTSGSQTVSGTLQVLRLVVGMLLSALLSLYYWWLVVHSLIRIPGSRLDGFDELCILNSL